jgi:hypothetical protein
MEATRQTIYRAVGALARTGAYASYEALLPELVKTYPNAAGVFSHDDIEIVDNLCAMHRLRP